MSQTRFKAEIYRDARQEFRWRVRAPNGRVVADGAEGYRNRVDCVRMLAMLRCRPRRCGTSWTDKVRRASESPRNIRSDHRPLRGYRRRRGSGCS